MKITRKRRWQNCLHEAGHAVVAWHHARHTCVPFESISTSGSGSELEPGASMGCITDPAPLGAWKDLQVIMAGALAADGCCSRGWVAGEWSFDFLGAGSDESLYVEIMESIGLSEAAVALCTREAEDILMAHRQKVREIARRLEAAGHLTYDDVADVIPCAF